MDAKQLFEQADALMGNIEGEIYNHARHSGELRKVEEMRMMLQFGRTPDRHCFPGCNYQEWGRICELFFRNTTFSDEQLLESAVSRCGLVNKEDSYRLRFPGEKPPEHWYPREYLEEFKQEVDEENVVREGAVEIRYWDHGTKCCSFPEHLYFKALNDYYITVAGDAERSGTLTDAYPALLKSYQELAHLALLENYLEQVSVTLLMTRTPNNRELREEIRAQREILKAALRS